jgi:Ca2+-binding RTX toxin-like protein
MNIIEVKGTRSNGDSVAPQGRERFEDKSESRNSHVPFYVGSAISALILYLKASLSPDAQAHTLPAEEPDHHPAAGRSQAAAEPHASGSSEIRQVHQEFAMISDSDAPVGKIKHQMLHRPVLFSSDHSGWYVPKDGNLRDSLDGQYQPIANSRYGNSNGAMSFPAISTNDNRIGESNSNNPVQTGRAGAGNTEGGTGGNGSTTEPETKKNRAPKISGPVLQGNQFTFTNISILAAALLANASDADADALAVKDVRINGVLLNEVHGSYTYRSEDLGPVVINYLVSDGKLSVAATAEIIFVDRPPIVGAVDGVGLGVARTAELSGGESGDQLFNNAGNDVLSGDDGNNSLVGGFGNDTLRGGSGNDTLYGDEGDDVLFGGSGRDYLYDGTGKDILNGEIGNDTVFASADANNDIFNGGAGINKLNYEAASSRVVFDLSKGIVSGADIGVDQATNFQVLQGGSGNDLFNASLNIAYTLSGLTDTIILSDPVVILPEQGALDGQLVECYWQPDRRLSSISDSELDPAQSPAAATAQPVDQPKDDDGLETPDELNPEGYTYLGGAGNDTLDYGAAQQMIVIDLSSGTARGAELATDYFASIESFVTGSGNDVFLASGVDTPHQMKVFDALALPEDLDCDVSSRDDVTINSIDLSDTSGDLVSGVAANQHFYGGAGTDTLDYSDAVNTVLINTATGVASGLDIGIDTFDSVERIVGGAGNDTFIIGTGAIIVSGEGGADVFQFITPTESAGADLTVTHIQGFNMGDLVRMSMYDLFDQEDPQDSDMFEDIYGTRQESISGETNVDMLVPIRVRFEASADHYSTYIDADLDNNGVFEITVQLDGNHHLTVVNNHIA